MKKILTAFIAGTSATIALIYLAGYGYIFKAVAMNLKKGSLTPSTDDNEKFPSHHIANANPIFWQKDDSYNTKKLSEKLMDDLKETRASSLIIIRDNKLIHEQYWKNHHEYSLTNSFSIAKGIISILVGCAIDDGYLQSEDQLLSSVLPDYKNSEFGRHLTFKHLMTMQAGLDWEEEYHHPFAPNSKQYFVDDLKKQALEVEVKEMPGEKYEYQSVAAQVLGIALTEATGMKLADYLSKKIWIPLGMELPAKWSIDEKGMEKAFCCIHATARDFAKIGQFILQNGNWNGQQILSEQFCKNLILPTQANDAFCYTVWANDDSNIKYRFFYGFLGQFIIMIPDKNIVIVKTGLSNSLEVDKKKRPHQVQLLVDEIIKMTEQ
ncbi:serine hydrolase domain-containing protein [Chryseobacterium wangxinyae]|uniref:serine hydrolase domain-containing protein n=1 Tax=Chryseobacterium sp. CY353 TaxID=2997334 RepID=UPI00226E7791|nr:serine hydrolase [Chryseobacterium sp. CY353]MCY0970486.1 serine hydrolase [Chryseobacterium sp. CY353]